MDIIRSKFEKLRNNFKKDNTKKLILDDIYDAKNELECAIRNFNEITQDEYVDIAIMNINLAKKKYEVRLKEAKGFLENNKAIWFKPPKWYKKKYHFGGFKMHIKYELIS